MTAEQKSNRQLLILFLIALLMAVLPWFLLS